MKVGVAGTGSYLPPRRLTNQELEKMVDTSDEWIRERTGIRERRIVDEGVVTSDLAVEASRQALAAASVSAEDVDFIIVATSTPDNIFPATACHVQHKIGATRAATIDISAACTGFIYGVAMGAQFIATGTYRNVLVIGAECLSKITDYTDRTTCILFGDGAGAVLLQADAPHGHVLSTFLRGDGSGGEVMQVPGGGSRIPASIESVQNRMHFMRIRGREVFKFAVMKMVELIEDGLRSNGISREELGLIIPHQVNMRIIELALKKLDIPPDQAYTNIDRYGNTSAASIPIALDEAVRENRLVSGKAIVCVAFGAGLTWGSLVMRW
ncbi:MAG: ketoacyl-ACP synthase III [Planctomycetes bacterium]|nr:ketoacyl-ACP synthase III [Planctomycetota bacterium]MBI3844644.1 ketoacyl-ACP synthase III [Planctomycetota bacterium]